MELAWAMPAHARVLSPQLRGNRASVCATPRLSCQRIGHVKQRAANSVEPTYEDDSHPESQFMIPIGTQWMMSLPTPA